jgi:hypothetical protein
MEADALALAAHELGADVLVADISDHVEEVVYGHEYFSTPPKQVVAAIQNSNVSIFTVNETYAFRIAHVIGNFINFGEECSAYKIDPKMGSWGLTREDPVRLVEIGDKIMSAINEHDEVRITTKSGTDVTLSVKGRKCLPIFSIPVRRRGNPFVHPIPLWAECNWAPIEDATEGRVIIDGLTEATEILQVVREPVEWIVKKGRVVEVNGGEDADGFRKVVNTDQGSGIIGEFGIGGSNLAMWGTESEKGREGTIHFGLGNNHLYPGGKNEQSKVHVDGGVRNVTVQVDGRTIVKDGHLAL